MIEHCGGHPSQTQAAIITQAEQLKMRLVAMDEHFIKTGAHSLHSARDYLSWSNSLVRLLRQLNLKGVTAPQESLNDYFRAAYNAPAQKATRPDREAA